MSTPRLFVSTVFIVAAIATAGAQSQPASQTSSAASLAKLPIMTGEFSLKDFVSYPKLAANPNATSSACYSIRDYKFSRTNPDSNVMKLSGYSECEPASSFQLKEVLTPHK